MSSFPKLPHVEAGTNLFVLNALETVVENNAERVFDFIVAEDVVVHFRKTSPAIAAVEDQSGTWNHALIGNVPDEFTQALTAYGLAKKAGLKHVTYLSVYQAERFLDVPHFAAKHAVEEAIREGGVPYTILRPGYFMQNDRLLKPLLTGPGVYPVPIGNQGIAVVDVRDIAEAAAISLTEEGHAGKTYDLVSLEMLSGPGAAAIWSRLLGKDVKYAGHGDFDAFEAQLRKTGNASWLAYDLRVMYQGYVERGFTHTESQTARIALLGREPREYSSYAEELMKQWTSQAEAA